MDSPRGMFALRGLWRNVIAGGAEQNVFYSTL
jgi:hypothetical protein